MPFIQSIDQARAEAIGAHGVAADNSPPCWRAPARRSPGCARATPTARCRCCGCRTKRDDLAAIPMPRRRCARRHQRHRRSSAPAARASAARRWRSSPATPCRASARCAIRRAFISWTISTPRPTPRCSQRLPLTTSRFVAVSKSGGTGETLMQTIAALEAVKAAGLDARIPEHFLGITEPAKARQDQRPARSAVGAHKIAMLDHDPGVGGRFSVLTNVGLLPAAVCRPRHRARSAKAPRHALAPVLASASAGEVPAAVGAALAARAGRRQSRSR